MSNHFQFVIITAGHNYCRKVSCCGCHVSDTGRPSLKGILANERAEPASQCHRRSIDSPRFEASWVVSSKVSGVMSDLNLRLSETAIVLAEERHVTRAGKRLKISQPAMTKRIKELDDYVGIVMFDRTGKHFEPTEACQGFNEEAKLGVVHLERARAKARAIAAGASTILAFGYSPYADPFFVSLVRATRLPLHPNLQFMTTSHFSEELRHKVLTGELDFALVCDPSEDALLTQRQLATSPLYVVFRDEHKFNTRKAIELCDLNEQTLVLFGPHVHSPLYARTLEALENAGARARELHQITVPDEAVPFLAEGAVALLPASGAWRIAVHGSTMRPLSEKALDSRLALVARADAKSRILSEIFRSIGSRLLALKPKNSDPNAQMRLAI